MSTQSVNFLYTFVFEKGNILNFKIKLNDSNLNLINNKVEKASDWARLENEQCENCTLKQSQNPYCPIALNLLDILPKFNDVYSFENVDVEVKTKERTFFSKVSVQTGLGAMLGIYMVTSGCPIMSKLKPMVRFHLPFATVEETIFRSASTYLLGQFIAKQNGTEPDWELNQLKESYKNIQIVNFSMARRLRSISEKDANINALIVLDIFAKEMPQSIDESLKVFQYLFD